MALGERRLPVFFQLAHDQPVLRLGQPVLAPGPVGGVVGPLQALPPDLVHLRPLRLDLLGRGQGDLQRDRGHGRQQQRGDVGVQAAAGQLLAPLGTVFDGIAGTGVERDHFPAGPPPVLRRHLAATPAADHQPAEQGRAVTRRARVLRPGPVGLQSLHVPLVLLDADVGRQHPGQVGHPVLAGLAHPPGVRPPGLPPPGVQAAAAVGVDPSVGRVAQHVLDPGPAGPAPFQLAPVGPLPHADPDLDVVVGQVGQHRVHRAEPVEELEDQAHHGLDLLVGVAHHLPRGPAHVAGGQRHRQLSAAGLAHPPGPHPLPDQEQLGLADRPLEPQQQPVVVVVGVVDPVGVGEQGPRDGAQLE